MKALVFYFSVYAFSVGFSANAYAKDSDPRQWVTFFENKVSSGKEDMQAQKDQDRKPSSDQEARKCGQKHTTHPSQRDC